MKNKIFLGAIFLFPLQWNAAFAEQKCVLRDIPPVQACLNANIHTEQTQNEYICQNLDRIVKRYTQSAYSCVLTHDENGNRICGVSESGKNFNDLCRNISLENCEEYEYCQIKDSL